eukprot:GHVU01024524.1.p1 GENE.GHVU01024524.1~~GHVU01024524.1.p1  ORF type:complete len:563 (+),score=60.23 GHVU01024524.1:394-2082(+)
MGEILQQSILPALEKDMNYDSWLTDVQATKMLSERWNRIPDAKKEEAEAWDLLLAVRNHQKARESLQQVFEMKQLPNSIIQTNAAWVLASYSAIKKVCAPLEADACKEACQDLEGLAEYAKTALAYDLKLTLERFRSLRAKAVKYQTGYPDRRLADILLQSVDPTVEAVVRATLSVEQQNPDKVLQTLEGMLAGAGSRLSRALPVVKEEDATAHYVKQTTPQSPWQGDQHSRSQSWKGAQRSRPQNPRPEEQDRASCRNCGKQHEFGRDLCPASNQACNYCQKPGHFGRVCRKKMRDERAPGNNRGGSPVGSPGQHGRGNESAQSARFVDLTTFPQYETGWKAQDDPTPCAKLWQVDTACSSHIFQAEQVAESIVLERPREVTYRTAEPGRSFRTHTEVVVAVSIPDDHDREQVLLLTGNACKQAASLIKPTHLQLLDSHANSWVSLTDYHGNVVRLRVDHPQGDSTTNIPYLTPKFLTKHEYANKLEHTVRRTKQTPSTLELQGMHARFCDPCPQRLHGTLAEQDYDIDMSTVVNVSKNCDTGPLQSGPLQSSQMECGAYL